MKKKIIAICLLSGLLISATKLADPPQSTISNGLISAKLYLPDPNTGYYQATRFDWAGLVASLDYKGHSFYGQWFDNYNPKTNDAVTGPVESFTPLNYDAVKPGQTFVDIGVGLLRRGNRRYNSFTLYDMVDRGKWTVKSKKDRVEFSQELHDSTGYAFIYTKTLRLVKGKPELILEHSLKNIGQKAIETDVFDHNFPVIDKEPTGPNMRIIFPFPLNPGTAPGTKGWGTIGKVNGNELDFLRELTKREQVYSPGIQGLTGTPKDYDFKIENTKTGAGIHIVGDQPLEKLVYWACPTTACPEPYIKISVQPGKEMKWNISYEYYTFTPDKSTNTK